MVRWYMTETHHQLPGLGGFAEPLPSCLNVLLSQLVTLQLKVSVSAGLAILPNFVDKLYLE